MKKKFLIFFVFVSFVFSSFADDSFSFSDREKYSRVQKDLKKILSPKIADELLANNKIFVYKYNKTVMTPQIAPKLAILKKMEPSIDSKNFSPIFLMEALYIFPRNNSDSEGSKTVDSARILKSISKLKGLKYYSHRRKKMRTLYVDSCAVKRIKPDGPDATEYQVIRDPVDKPTDGLSILASQEDLTFGRYVYRYDYFEKDASIATVCTNTETLKYKIFNVISAEKLKIVLVVKEYDDFVLVYSVTRANFTRLPGLKKKIKNSFSSRADAMYKWFVSEYRKAEKKGE